MSAEPLHVRWISPEGGCDWMQALCGANVSEHRTVDPAIMMAFGKLGRPANVCLACLQLLSELRRHRDARLAGAPEFGRRRRSPFGISVPWTPTADHPGPWCPCAECTADIDDPAASPTGPVPPLPPDDRTASSILFSDGVDIMPPRK